MWLPVIVPKGGDLAFSCFSFTVNFHMLAFSFDNVFILILGFLLKFMNAGVALVGNS